MVLRLPGVPSLDDLSPEWALGGSTGAGVRVAVIDSGIESNHPALEGCVDEGITVALDDEGNASIVPAPGTDSFGHGTACAGIIHSIAPQARLTSVQVLGPGLTGKAAAFLSGLGWAIESGFDVINLSLGTTRRDWALPFYELCDEAYFRGCLIVTAANNVNRVSYPSLFGSVISVACNMATDPMRFHWNPDPPTEFLARGIDVEVPWRDGGWIRSTGNSYAAPHISGIVALIRSKHPKLRPFQVKTAMWASATNVREAHDKPIPAGRLSRAMRPVTMSSARATGSLRAVTNPSRPG